MVPQLPTVFAARSWAAFAHRLTGRGAWRPALAGAAHRQCNSKLARCSKDLVDSDDATLDLRHEREAVRGEATPDLACGDVKRGDATLIQLAGGADPSSISMLRSPCSNTNNRFSPAAFLVLKVARSPFLISQKTAPRLSHCSWSS